MVVGGAHESWQFCIVVPGVVLLAWQRDLETVPFMGFAYQGLVSDTGKALLSVTSFHCAVALRIIYVSRKHHWGSQASFSKLPLCPCTVSGILGGQKLDVQWQQTQQQSSKSETPIHHVSEAFINLVVELSWTWENVLQIGGFVWWFISIWFARWSSSVSSASASAASSSASSTMTSVQHSATSTSSPPPQLFLLARKSRDSLDRTASPSLLRPTHRLPHWKSECYPFCQRKDKLNRFKYVYIYICIITPGTKPYILEKCFGNTVTCLLLAFFSGRQLFVVFRWRAGGPHDP